MKSLFLLRHAHAESNQKNDINRHLTDEGILKCQTVAPIIIPYLSNIDLILSSHAVRTKQTIESIFRDTQIKNKEILYDKNLYNLSEEELLEYITNIETQISMSPKGILLVNHNPGISRLASFLAQESSISPYYLDVLEGFDPASLALFQAKIESWQQLSPENTILKNFWR